MPRQDLKDAIEKAVSDVVFDFNDPVVRSDFVSIVENIAESLGIKEFRAICDETNNTPEILDANKFAVDMYYMDEEKYYHLQMIIFAEILPTFEETK